jgi:hypothetical protein
MVVSIQGMLLLASLAVAPAGAVEAIYKIRRSGLEPLSASARGLRDFRVVEVDGAGLRALEAREGETDPTVSFGTTTRGVVSQFAARPQMSSTSNWRFPSRRPSLPTARCRMAVDGRISGELVQ